MPKKQDKRNEIRRNRRMSVANQLRYDKNRSNKIGGLCEGLDFVKHMCKGRVEVNEVIFPRNIFQKSPFDKQLYFFHKINCALNCSFFHEVYGHRRKYRDWHLERVARVYGIKEVSEWLSQAPVTPENMIWMDTDMMLRVKESEVIDDTNDYLF